VEFSKNIHAAGNDLMNLISDILDLSKIESGTVEMRYDRSDHYRQRNQNLSQIISFCGLLSTWMFFRAVLLCRRLLRGSLSGTN
jgi:hypothetical protein